MGNKLARTGFGDISIDRINYHGTDPWFIELAITSDCNFNCHYCNRMNIPDTSFTALSSYFKSFNKAKRIHITGGEPYLHSDFDAIIDLCNQKSENVSISTNGSMDISRYLNTKVDCFNISLDDNDLAQLSSRGYRNASKVIKNIKQLSNSGIKVVTGTIIDERNIDRINDIIDFILDLGVYDIKLSVSSFSNIITNIQFKEKYNQYHILSYRLKNFSQNINMRGLNNANRCYIMESDVSIVGNYHYPCLIYARENGSPIGMIGYSTPFQRKEFFYKHNPKHDKICSKYCMDFKCEFNNFKENHK